MGAFPREYDFNSLVPWSYIGDGRWVDGKSFHMIGEDGKDTTDL